MRIVNPGSLAEVRINQDHLPLDGRTKSYLVDALKAIAEDIEDGNWETYMHIIKEPDFKPSSGPRRMREGEVR